MHACVRVCFGRCSPIRFNRMLAHKSACCWIKCTACVHMRMSIKHQHARIKHTHALDHESWILAWAFAYHSSKRVLARKWLSGNHISLFFYARAGACWRVLAAIGGGASHSLPNGQHHQQHTSGAELFRDVRRSAATSQIDFVRSRNIAASSSCIDALLHRSVLLVVNVSGIIFASRAHTHTRSHDPIVRVFDFHWKSISRAGWRASENFLHEHYMRRNQSARPS